MDQITPPYTPYFLRLFLSTKNPGTKPGRNSIAELQCGNYNMQSRCVGSRSNIGGEDAHEKSIARLIVCCDVDISILLVIAPLPRRDFEKMIDELLVIRKQPSESRHALLVSRQFVDFIHRRFAMIEK